MKVAENISLRELNSFGVEARAARLVEWETARELVEVDFSGPWMALGSGNNVLFTRDYAGTIVKSAARRIEITGEGRAVRAGEGEGSRVGTGEGAGEGAGEEEGTRTGEGEEGGRVFVRAEAGVDWDDLVAWCVERGLWGVENLSAIPGTVGAAPIQNIGAYGAEAKDVIVSVECFAVETGNFLVLAAEHCEFGYRDSVFKRSLRGKVIVTAVNFALSRVPKPNLGYGALAAAVAKSQKSGVKSQESANAGGKLGDEAIRRLDDEAIRQLDDEAIRQLDDELTRHRSCAAQKLRGVNVGSIAFPQSDAGGGRNEPRECQPPVQSRRAVLGIFSSPGRYARKATPALGGGGLRTSNEVRANATQISAPPTAPSGGADGFYEAGKPAALRHHGLITHDSLLMTHNSLLMTLPRERLVSFVSTERPRVANLRVGDVVALGRAPYTGWLGRLSAEDERVVDQSINVVGISSFVTKQLDTLSDGEAQRVMIARALAQDTPVILLDEPTAFLDFHSRREIVELLCDLAHKHGKTVVFSSHELDLVKEFSDKIIQL